MKKKAPRLISLLLTLVMLLSMSPVVMAADAEQPEAEVIEETTQEFSEELPEELPPEEELPAEEPPAEEEQSAETPSEEEQPAETEADTPSEEEQPAEEHPSEETPAQETEDSDSVKVTFTFNEEFRLALPADGEFTAAQKAEGEEIWSLELSLVPGSYTWLAQAVAHKDSEATSLEIPEGSEDLVIALELEEYPYGLEGMELGFAVEGEVAEEKEFLEDYDVLNIVAGLTPGEDYIDEEVYFLADTEEYALQVAAAYNAELVSFEYGVAVIRLPEGLSVSQAVAASADKELRLPAVNPNYIVTLDDPQIEEPDEGLSASFAKAPTQSWLEWKSKKGANADPFLQNPADHYYQYNHEILNTYEAWAVTTGSSKIKVVVVDTGIDIDHPDLKIEGTGYYSSDYTSAQDDDDHGSNCAGIIAAQMGNGIGGSGIAPGVSLYAYKSMSTDGGSTAAIVAGYNYARTIGADIISASIGGIYPDSTEYYALLNAVNDGITVVVAAGNDSSNIMEYPAAFNIPGLICVGATDRANKQCYFSDYGKWVDILAPGENIYSCNQSGGYGFMSGTSQATPAVAGVCALYMSMYGHRQVSPAEMEKVIKSCKTNGVLDAYKVVSKGYAKAVKQGFTAASLSANLSDRYAESSSIPQNVTLTLSNETLGTGEYIAYTLDGTVPGCIDGELVNGAVYNGGISLESFAPGTEITLTARCIASNGEEAPCLTRSFTVAEPKDFTSITLTGPGKLDAEKKEAFKVCDCFGEDITSNVTWKICLEDGTPCNDVTVDKEGFISYPAEKTGKLVITALSENGGGASLNVEFVKASLGVTPVSSVIISANQASTYEAVSAVYDKKGILKTVTLYNADHVNTSSIKENMVTLSTNVSSGYAEWKSSNPKVATVNASGVVTAVGKGNATITCTANDGSKKKATVKIVVKVPASSVSISSNNTVWSGDRDSEGFDTNEYLLAIGKSVSNKAVLGDAYGKPSDTKVYWSAEMSIYDSEWNCLYSYDPGYYFSISSSGRLSVKNTIKTLTAMQDSSYKVCIDVYAIANTDQYNAKWRDGDDTWDDEIWNSCVSNCISYRIQWPTKEIACIYYSGSYAYYYKNTYLSVGCYYKDVTVDYYASDRNYPTYCYEGNYIVTSSNPNVAGAYVTSSGFRVISGQKKGTATITVKTIDGTNKSYKFKVIVR